MCDEYSDVMEKPKSGIRSARHSVDHSTNSFGVKPMGQNEVKSTSKRSNARHKTDAVQKASESQRKDDARALEAILARMNQHMDHIEAAFKRERPL